MKRIRNQTLVSKKILEFDTIILQWATGYGKSLAAIKALKAVFNSNFRILLLVAESAHKQNWESEFTKHKFFPKSNLTIECYASLKKYPNTHWDFIIFDEAHHLFTEKRLAILGTLSFDKAIFLSATLKKKQLEILDYLYPNNWKSTITLNDGFESEVLPEPLIKIIPLILDNTKKDLVYTQSWGDSHKRVIIECDMKSRWEYMKNKVKYPNVTLQISCTEQEYYNELNNQYEYWKNTYMRQRQEWQRNKWLRAGLERKKWLGELKTSRVLPLIQSLNRSKTRYICFCNSILQAEVLGGKNYIHSKRMNNYTIISRFNEHKIDNLFAVGMLQEGMNLNDIESGIIIQLDGSERPFIQKFGRTLRSREPVQYIFYFKDTKDEDYLNKVLENIDIKYIEQHKE